MQNEALKTLMYYLQADGTKVHYCGSNKGVLFFRTCLENGRMILFDAPDLVFIYDDEGVALAIEHFEFDSSSVTGKGSRMRMEEARINRENSKYIVPTEGIVIKNRMRYKNSYDNYITNATRNFNDHYHKIGTYKNNLKVSRILPNDTHIKIAFLIDDVSPLGSVVFNNDKNNPQQMPVILAMCPEFLNLLKNRPDVDYVLCCSSISSNDNLWFVDCKELDEYIENAVEYSNMRFLYSNPHVITTMIQIPQQGETSHEHI